MTEHPAIKERDHQATPHEITDYVRETWGEFFDPCPLHGKKDCFKKTFKWPEKKSTPIFINPPFSQLKRWVLLGADLCEKLQYETVIVLSAIQKKTLSRLYWRDRVYGKCEIQVLPGDLPFGNYTSPPAFSVALLVFGTHAKLGTISYIRDLDKQINFAWLDT